MSKSLDNKKEETVRCISCHNVSSLHYVHNVSMSRNNAKYNVDCVLCNTVNEFDSISHAILNTSTYLLHQHRTYIVHNKVGHSIEVFQLSNNSAPSRRIVIRKHKLFLNNTEIEEWFEKTVVKLLSIS